MKNQRALKENNEANHSSISNVKSLVQRQKGNVTRIHKESFVRVPQLRF